MAPVRLAGCGGGSPSADLGASLDAAVPPDAAQPDQAVGPRKLTLLYTNDEHSHLFGFAPEVDDFPIPTVAGAGALKGSVARRVVVLNRERAAAQAAGAATLTLSSGDHTIGTLSEVDFQTSATDFTLMKAMGYDATCLGNHEFDFGPAALAAALGVAQAQNGHVPTSSRHSRSRRITGCSKPPMICSSSRAECG